MARPVNHNPARLWPLVSTTSCARSAQMNTPDTTYPFVYDDPSALPADQSTIERRLGARLAPSLNPSPLSARGRDFLVGIEWSEALADMTPPPRLAYPPATKLLRSRHAKSIDPGPPPF